MEELCTLLQNLKEDRGCQDSFELRLAAEDAGYIDAALEDGLTESQINRAIKSCF